MAACVFCQVVAPHKAAVANRTGEALLSCVRAPMTRQFIRSGKPPQTAVPAAPERLLTCVCSQVCFQVGAFEVRLPTVGMGADVIAGP